ncbi:hypothetical protein B0J13DRAFT_572414 [Dactylonectria estremocensis]|uniref:Uncharacterized protein n=1 Tax=Dactylonectria estremocensis TaxID=1079267 RepID=A0A9P9DAN0_9HYPO|nr:hypothetical protein B0J13DRAFT_572414 [Dactylonectria estremocensis]
MTPGATVDVAYAWQSGHRSAQRSSTYGLDGAFPDQLQPTLLRAYARVSAEWHAFLAKNKPAGPEETPVGAGGDDEPKDVTVTVAPSRGQFGSRSSGPQPSFLFDLVILGSLMPKEHENAILND